MRVDDLARDYLRLALALEQYQPGLLDAYFGPTDLREDPAPPLADLARQAGDLVARAAEVSDPARRDFLTAQLTALRTTARRLQGEPMSLTEEVEGLYDIRLERVPDAVFESALRHLDALLPGSGSLRDREMALRDRFALSPEQLTPLLEPILTEYRARTLTRFGLPEGESFEVRLVGEEPWGAYNWYLGGLRSRIDVNTDLPSYLPALPDLLAHEGYPGHHTEHAHKEQTLYREAGRLEHAAQLINAPECVISEGVAVWAQRMVMDDAELAVWLAAELLPASGLDADEDDLKLLLEVQKAKQPLKDVNGNAALLLHEDGAAPPEVCAYLERYRLARPEEASKTLEFLEHPSFRSYSFTYTAGERLLEPWITKGGQAAFARLLTEPLTPAALARLA